MRSLTCSRPFLFAVLGVLLAFTPLTQAEHQCSPDGVAVGGYDLVSYHSEEGPLMGTTALTMTHDGLSYRFANPANLQQFSQNPDRFLPRYRGFCATTLAMGRLVCPNYRNFKIEDGDLLLFEMTGFTNGRTLWDSDPLGFRQRADAFAKKLLGL